VNSIRHRLKVCRRCKREYTPTHGPEVYCRDCIPEPSWHHPPRRFLTPEELEACQEDPRKVWTIRGPGFIACDICGQLLKELDLHLRLRHGMRSAEYRARPGPDGIKPRYNKGASLWSVSSQKKHSRIARRLRLGRLGRAYGRAGGLVPTGGARTMSLQHDLNVGDASRGKPRPDLWKRTPELGVADDTRIVLARLGGKTQAEIAKALGVDQAAVSVRLRRIGFPAGRACLYQHGEPVTGEHVVSLTEDYGVTGERVAERLRVSPHWVSLHRARHRRRTLSVRMARRVLAVDRTLLHVYRVRLASPRGGRPRQLPPNKERKLAARYQGLLADLRKLRAWLRVQDSPPNRDKIWRWLCELSRSGKMQTLFFWPQFFDWVRDSYESEAFLRGAWAPRELAVVWLADDFGTTDDVVGWMLSHQRSSGVISDR